MKKREDWHYFRSPFLFFCMVSAYLGQVHGI